MQPSFAKQSKIFSCGNCNPVMDDSIQDISVFPSSTVYSDGAALMALNPAGPVNVLTVVFPSAPGPGQPFAINSSQKITTLTLQSVYPIQGYTAPGPFNGTPALKWIFSSAQSKWLIA